MVQETLIFIDDNDKTNANLTAKSFAHQNTRHRAYFNTIGASLVTKYLSSEGIDAKGNTGLHSIKKILEEFDVSDIILPNIRLDVRVIFDENAVFIPKSHFEHDIVPDIYVAVKPSNDLTNVKILGFFEPSLINKNNANKDYYFIEKEKLTSGENLIDYIKSYQGATAKSLSNDELEAFEQIIMKFSDNDIEDKEKNYLIQQLKFSPELREKYIEYENFETLSYKAMTDPMIDVPELPQDTVSVDEFDIFDAQPIEQAEPIAEEFQPQIETEEIEPVINSEEPETVENIEPVSDITNEEPADNINNILDGIDVIDENVLGNVSEIADLAGAEAGFEAVNTVSDTMENILFDNETVEAIDSIDNAESKEEVIESAEVSELQENIAEPLDITETLETIEEPQEEVIETLDESDFQEENIAEDNNMLSFDDVIVPETLEQSETVNETEENTLSFDTIEAPELNISEESVTDEANLLSFDDVIAPEIEQPQEIEQADNVLSFDNIEVPETEAVSEEAPQEETLSFDDVVAPELEISEKTTESENLLSFDDVKTPEAEVEEFNENSIPLDEMPQTAEEHIEEPSDDFENVDLDSVIKPEAETKISDEVQMAETFDNIQEVSAIQDAEEDIEMFNTSENSFDTAGEENSKTFGNNLLENLNEESLDNIVIESAGTSDENGEEISSDLLLSQIDDVLNSSQTTTNENESFSVPQGNDENKLDVLYSEENVQPPEMEEISEFEEEPQEEELTIPGGALLKQKPASSKKILVTTALLVAIIAGVSAFVLLKPKNNETANVEQPVNNETTVQETAPDNILEANAPQEIKTEQTQQVDKSAVQEMKNTGTKTQKPTASMNVTKVVWDVPSSVLTNEKMQTFLRATGKSIRLSLSTDLLLAGEYAYTNFVKVNVPINSSGNIESAQIASSSGSTEIDNIVLQSVNDTLNVIKPPADAFKGQSTQLTLIIYF